MATRDQLYTALRNADAAGDNDGAAKLAAYIKTLPPDVAPAETPPADVPPADSTLKQIAMAPVGAAEEFLKAGTGALSSIPAGLAYGGAAVGKAFGADVDPDDVQKKVKDVLTYQPVSNSGKAADQALADTYGPVAANVADHADKAATAVGKVSPTAETLLRAAPGAAQAAGAIVPAVAGLKAAAGEISTIRATREANAPDWQKAGLRTAEDNPVARNAAGPSGKEALGLHNRAVGNTIAAHEAGTPSGVPITQDALIKAREAPGAVRDRVADALPTGQLDSTAAEGIRKAGLPEGGRITAGSPAAQQQIEALRSQLLDPERQFTGRQVVNEVSGLRQEGFGNVASEDVSNQQLGKAQLDMARALEGHIERNLPPGADVSQEQYLAARKALAKNYTVQGALRGNDVDMKALARAYRADPTLLDGGTQTLAKFADTHGEVAALPAESTRYNPPGLGRDVSDINLKSPASWVRPLAAGPVARRVLTGSQEEAIAQANAMYPPRDPSQFAPIPPPPKPAIAGLLEAPKPPDTMVNAGGGATTPAALNDLGLSPDVQAAAAAHPGAPRPGVPLPAPAPPAPAPVDFQPPQNWSSVLQPNGPVPAPAPRSPASMYADVLSQGVEQPPPAGLSLAPHVPPSADVIPFQRNAAHEAGDLKLAPEDAWFKPGARSKGSQYADVLSGKVPNKFRDRGAPTTNNASGESAASVEAINRGTRPLAIVSPDGIEQPVLKDVTQADRKAPKGSLIIDTSTGEIIDRGGLNAAQANGLRNRWAAQTPEQQRLRLQAQALRN